MLKIVSMLKTNLLQVILFLCFFSNSVKSTGQHGNTQNSSSSKSVNFAFTLKDASKTSAGVYFKDGTLLRTLWSGTNYEAGKHIAKWDGLDDDGKPAPDSLIDIKVLSNNVKYEWEGARIGNTSTALTGSTKLRLFEPVRGIAISGTTAYFAGGYNEGWPGQFRVDLSDPNSKTWIGKLKATDQASDYVATDGKLVYWGGYDPLEDQAKPETFVFATEVGNDRQYQFLQGVPASMGWGGVYPSTISYMVLPHSHISGMAVQKQGKFLFVARGGLNQLQVLEKTTGKIVRTLSFEDVRKCVIDGNDNLWFAYRNKVEKFEVNNNGTLTTTNVVINIENAAALAVSPDNRTLILSDMKTQQVKAYSNKDGEYLWTLGNEGGYLKDATVTDTKFYLKDIRSEKLTYLAYLPNGSFYVGDVGNLRTQHYSASRSFIDRIMFLQNVYNTSVDKSNPKRVFSDFLEFEVDYSKPMGASNNSWKLVKNWGGNFGAEYDQFNKILNITTLKNGRTYGMLRIQDRYFIVELVEGGVIRNTGIVFKQRTFMNEDGSKITNPGTAFGYGCALIKYALKGFDNKNNPIWSEDEELLSNTPPVNAKDPAPWEGFRGDVITKSNNLIYFDYTRAVDGHSTGYHLGAIKKGTNKWLWRTAKSTDINYNGPFPADGSFDNGNGVVAHGAGGPALISGNQIFWGYHGEFWKQSQTNKWNQVDGNTGLFVGQFGVLTSDHQNQEAFAGGAGNVLTGTAVEVNGTTYLYHNDESVHGGVHRWKITGLNTIEIQIATITTDNFFTEGVDLLDGLERGVKLKNGKGWNRGSDPDEWGENIWNIATGLKTYDPFKSPDVNIVYGVSRGSRTLTRDLGNNENLTSWKLKGKMNFENSAPTQAHFKGIGFVEVLDKNNLIISRFDLRQDFVSGQNVVGNDKIIFHGTDQELDAIKNYSQPIEIGAKNGVLTFSYAGLTEVSTLNKVDANAKWQEPAILKFYFSTSNPADNHMRFFNISEMKFIAVKPAVSQKSDYFQSKNSGNWDDVKSWETSSDGINWNVSILVPDSSANIITIKSGHIIRLTDVKVVDQLVINNGGLLNVAPTAAILVNDGIGDDILINAEGSMVIQSNATGTGSIGKSTGSIVGNVTVERFLPGKKLASYRMLAPSVNSSSSIKNNWQEGANNTSLMMNRNPVPGYGIHITGSTSSDNGFDASLTGQASLFTFNQLTDNPVWLPIANTNQTKLDAKTGYLVFVRGDRSADLSSGLRQPESTTLRATGQVLTGTVKYQSLKGDGKNNLISNPYASPINWVKIQEDNSNQFENYYTLWDPNVGSKGGYVTVDASGTTSVRTSAATTNIQSGQAFIVKTKSNVTSPDFVVKETHKSLTGNPLVFRTTNAFVSKLYTSLYYTDDIGNRNLADGVLSRFDDSYTPEVDGDDAEDIANFDENISLQRNSNKLSIESLPTAKDNGILHLTMINMLQRSYEWQFNASDFRLTNSTYAFLKDKYLGTEIPIDLEGTTVIVFVVNNNAASADPQRFTIVFEQIKTLPVNILSVNGYKSATGINVEWKTTNEVNLVAYEVERSDNGVNFVKVAQTKPTGTTTSINDYLWFDASPKSGYNYYRIKSVNKDGSFQFSTVKRVLIDKAGNAFNIYPNPIRNGNFQVEVSNLLSGKYTINLYNLAGQVIVNKVVDHNGGTLIYKISADNLPSGLYKTIIGNQNISITKNLIKF